MKDHVTAHYVRARGLWALSVLLVLGIGLGASLAVGQSSSQQDKEKTSSGKSVGFIFSEDASAKDVGLPIYPGAQRFKDSSDESSSVQMGLWGGSKGFKLVVLKLQSDDAPEKIAAFYRKALRRYGTVVDCSASSADRKKSDSDGQFDCEQAHPEAGGFAFTAGTKRNQHIVAVEPDGKHAKISLVYLWTPKPDDKED